MGGGAQATAPYCYDSFMVFSHTRSNISFICGVFRQEDSHFSLDQRGTEESE